MKSLVKRPFSPRRWPKALLVLGLAVSCELRGPASGTAVGNPGTTALRTGPVQGLPWARAALPVSDLTLTGCDGSSTKVDVGQTVDLLGGARLTLPAGSWCRLQLSASGPLVLQGTASSGGAVSLTLDLPAVSFTGAIPMDGSALVIELGGPEWVEGAGYDPATGAAVSVAIGDAAAAGWTTALLGTSGVYTDDDDDGTLSEDERAEGSVEELEGDAGDTDDADEAR